MNIEWVIDWCQLESCPIKTEHRHFIVKDSSGRRVGHGTASRTSLENVNLEEVEKRILERAR